jgi:hypothetical protein
MCMKLISNDRKLRAYCLFALVEDLSSVIVEVDLWHTYHRAELVFMVEGAEVFSKDT